MPYANVEDKRAHSRRYKEQHRERVRELSRESWKRVGQKWRAHRKQKYTEARSLVIEAYGGKCVCCGETDHKKLTLHHRNHDGEQERKARTRVVVRYALPVRDDLILACHKCHANERKRPRGTPSTWDPIGGSNEQRIDAPNTRPDQATGGPGGA